MNKCRRSSLASTRAIRNAYFTHAQEVSDHGLDVRRTDFSQYEAQINFPGTSERMDNDNRWRDGLRMIHHYMPAVRYNTYVTVGH